MAIELKEEHLAAIRKHGEASFPEECGGLLLGIEKEGRKLISEVLQLENIRKDSRHNRVELSPLDYMKAEREAAKLGLGVWGYYHSHPDHPAVPSGFDLDHAPFVEWSYLIVSVRSGRGEEIRAWKLKEDRSGFEEDILTTNQ